MAAEAFITCGRKWQQEYQCFGPDGVTAYDLTGCTVAASLFVEGLEFTLSAGIVSPPTAGIVLLELAANATAVASSKTLPGPSVAEVAVAVTQGGSTLSAGGFQVMTRKPGATPEPVLEEA